jgi:predicted amidohydrolase YtcJ
MKEGVHVTFGSDWFVAPPSPLKGMFAAVTRRTLDGKNPDGWVPEQKIGLEDALRSYTREGAYASFDEKIKGTLETGKLADMVILEKNIFEIDPAELFDAKVDGTIVGGKVVYDRGKKWSK